MDPYFRSASFQLYPNSFSGPQMGDAQDSTCEDPGVVQPSPPKVGERNPSQEDLRGTTSTRDRRSLERSLGGLDEPSHRVWVVQDCHSCCHATICVLDGFGSKQMSHVLIHHKCLFLPDIDPKDAQL